MFTAFTTRDTVAGGRGISAAVLDQWKRNLVAYLPNLRMLVTHFKGDDSFRCVCSKMNAVHCSACCCCCVFCEQQRELVCPSTSSSEHTCPPICVCRCKNCHSTEKARNAVKRQGSGPLSAPTTAAAAAAAAAAPPMKKEAKSCVTCRSPFFGKGNYCSTCSKSSRPCSLEFCTAKARHGMHWCTIEHCRLDCENQKVHINRCANCTNIVMPGTGRFCSTHTQRKKKTIK